MQHQKLNFKTPPIQSLGEILARLTAKDGFTINGITKSEFIRDSVSAKDINCPFYIPGKCGAVEVRQIVEERLKHFGAKLESDVVAVTSDGQNVMKKFAREGPCEMVLCVNHAIHLAILDKFCKNQSEVTAARNALHNDDEHSSSDEHSNSYETSSTDNDDESYISNEEPRPQIIDDINNVMTETRSIIRFFRKSPLKSITLQKHVVAEFEVELVLLLDVRTQC
ncbi:unnamed protein product [Arctia plantaginis]|uniref:DUF659 domain-containing protein n=1 Tax=Arctia plantaginis TaxID=874455 RepID=A0A8S0ZZ96_ARCPL|nr:unnamed protein product [Arctia plantaginis]